MRTKLIYKDILILIRDRGGLAMLFIMPVALVVIMTGLQDSTFRSLNERGISLLLLNQDEDSLGLTIEKKIRASAIFSVHTPDDSKELTGLQVKEAVASGHYQIGLIIPRNSTQQIRDRVKKNVTTILSGGRIPEITTDSVILQVYIDPATQSTLRTTVEVSVRELAARIESQIVLSELAREISSRMRIPLSDPALLNQETVYYREEFAAQGNRKVIPNSVQHNVSAWTLFAMFFIGIPFAGAMIREREDGSFARLLTMPCSYFSIMFSKVIVYLVVCYLQFFLIMAMGIYIFPLLNLPALVIDGRMGTLSLLAVTVALAAIGYGIAIGTIARTHQQASIFASISVVILAAVGGIWVPIFMMPPLFRHISQISPLNWGLNGFYDILIRGAGIRAVLPDMLYLLLFATACLLLSLYYHKMRKDLI
ncbi:MAG: type transporter [Bacteroidetes bacterium]|nr:type transporter [Bacteroidota bacterium]